jgi:hypothetical protein
VPINEKGETKPWVFVEAAGIITGTGMAAGSSEGVSQDGQWWLVSNQSQATPIQSLYIWLDKLPSKVTFGALGGHVFQVDDLS